ncbi:SDR family NAD(P)-dependent oxidoreductase [Paenibacillus eucommiae]|uniref:NAD(P)-dependent dehydrogenase (Short-subunit alcohol dehydrogenase family) n=1 Tax=Paenibacillus eucommiae TaxID=1355755 RepID=A0ABS4J6U9_9BACL|nr:SDR family oxidoreductase [Paenibacillus eucommiae]MBP1995586.1 NAD(P)-dependent dehydrogenase (short-subunit alcohol dehydrogenase family) [Paenibacillus eucommiae]
MDSMQLNNKVILISGALGAGGRAAVNLFLERGAIVAACDIKSEQDFPEKNLLLERYGSGRLLYKRTDVCKEEDVKDLVELVEQTFGRLDGSYHNAYVNKVGTIANQSLQDWEDNIRGTLTSTFLFSKYAASLMMKSGGGSIVNTSSVLGTMPRIGNGGYGAGKAGLEHLTRIIAVEYAPYGIRANVVVPGDFKSDEVLANIGQQHMDMMKEISLLGRSGRANEINEVAAFLLSDAASYVTGSLYPVTGGIWK